jgi:hypothetical protein
MPTLPEVGGDASLAKVLEEVAQERARQDQKHGSAFDDQHAPSYWIGLVDRTIAKVEGTALMLDKGGGWAGSPGNIKWYRETLLRVAALAVAAIQACDRGACRREGA